MRRYAAKTIMTALAHHYLQSGQLGIRDIFFLIVRS
jgi:hypothetical protein